MTMTPNPNSEDWQPARTDDILRLGQRLRGVKSRRQFLRAGLGTVAASVGVVFAWSAMRQSGEFRFGGITCTEVAALADDYQNGRTSPADTTRVREHILRCPNCKPKFEAMS